MITVITVLSIAVACAERQADDDADEPFVRCAMVVAYITTEAETFRLRDSATGSAQVMDCFCTTTEELGDQEFRAMVNASAYDTCVAFVEREGYSVEQSNCVADYESGYFGQNFGYGQDPAAPPARCAGSAAGCGVN